MWNKLIIMLMLIFPALGHAEQRLMVREGGNVTANISASDLNKIAVQGDRILMVKGNAGQFQLEKDLTLGQIYIQPTETEDKRPIHLYITTEQGKTYSLTLLSVDMPAENIILISNHHQTDLATWENTSSYEELMVRIIKAMHNQSNLEGFTSSELVKNHYKIKNLSIKNQDNFIGTKLQGYRFEIQNISEKEITLKESDFYKNGVRAIAILNKTLPPQSKTILYTVSGV